MKRFDISILLATSKGKASQKREAFFIAELLEYLLYSNEL
tara:strand:- start:505 stop:624 length:120 start_codon:yes stop_codon:yes gene_type:complete